MIKTPWKKTHFHQTYCFLREKYGGLKAVAPEVQGLFKSKATIILSIFYNAFISLGRCSELSQTQRAEIPNFNHVGVGESNSEMCLKNIMIICITIKMMIQHLQLWLPVCGMNYFCLWVMEKQNSRHSCSLPPLV